MKHDIFISDIEKPSIYSYVSVVLSKMTYIVHLTDKINALKSLPRSPQMLN